MQKKTVNQESLEEENKKGEDFENLCAQTRKPLPFFSFKRDFLFTKNPPDMEHIDLVLLTYMGHHLTKIKNRILV